MTITQILPFAATVAIIGYAITITMRRETAGSSVWIFPAILSVAFGIFTLLAIAQDGLTGFWPVHSHNLWGNQVWIDLLLSLAIGWTLLLPQARKLGMRVWLWLAFMCFTGSIGLLAAIARYLYLRERQTAQVV